MNWINLERASNNNLVGGIIHIRIMPPTLLSYENYFLNPRKFKWYKLSNITNPFN